MYAAGAGSAGAASTKAHEKEKYQEGKVIWSMPRAQEAHDCMDAVIRHPGGRATQEQLPRSGVYQSS